MRTTEVIQGLIIPHEEFSFLKRITEIQTSIILLTLASPLEPSVAPTPPLAACSQEGEWSSGSQQIIQGIAEIVGRKMEKIINSAFNFCPPPFHTNVI